eukprot:10746109-Ditylum_brightwellii.AAC.1
MSNLDLSWKPSFPVNYYTKLRQSTKTVKISTNSQEFTTFEDPHDWLTLSSIKFNTLTFNHAEAISGPFDLAPPHFGTSISVVDLLKTLAELDKHVFIHAYNCILEELFAQLCPNFVSDPEVIISNLKQEYKDDDMNDIVQMKMDHQHS